MLLRRSVECSGERRSAPRLGMGGLLLLVAVLALTFPLGAFAKSSPSSALGHGGTAAPAGVLGPLVPNSWASGAVYPSTITRYAYAQSGQDLYVLGGVSNGVRVANANWYNATTNIWAAIAPVPVASEAPAAALLRRQDLPGRGRHRRLVQHLRHRDEHLVGRPSATGVCGQLRRRGRSVRRQGVRRRRGTSSATDTTSIYTVATNSWTMGASRTSAVLPRGLYHSRPVPLRRRRLQPGEPDGERRRDDAARHGDRDLVARADVHARASRRGPRGLG